MNEFLTFSASGMTLLFNGAFTVLSAILSPMSMLVAVLSGGLARLAALEISQLDEQARKPHVARH